MAKHKLDRTWLYAGQTYGPGDDVEMDDATAKALKEKGAFGDESDMAVASPASPPLTSTEQHSSDGAKASDRKASDTPAPTAARK